MEDLAKRLEQCEQNLRDKQEELESQRGMLSSAIDELVEKNHHLSRTLEVLEYRNAEVEQLLYQSSHGLRSPLSSIKGILKLLQYEPHSSASSTYYQLIELKLQHMLEIMNSLSTLSKLNTEEVQPMPVDIDAIIRKNIDYFAVIARANNVGLEYTSELGGKMVNTDAFLLTAIVKQIIMNGIFFRNADRSGSVIMSSQLEESRLIVRISDDGDGIPAEIKSRVFEMFFRGSEKSGGSGLGLYIAKKAAELLQGEITFTSDNQGTIFEISIPQSEE